MPDDFSPTDLLARMLRDWPLVALMMVIGGLTAWGVHQFRPALYESQAVFTFAFNLARTGAMTEKEEDYAMGAAAAIMTTSPIPETVVGQARLRGIPLEPNPLNRSVFLERKSYRWTIRVRLPDPQAAAFVANAWAERATQELVAAASHAERTETLRSYQASLVNCLNEMVMTGPAIAECPLKSLADVQRELQTTGNEIEQERAAARGFMPYLLFNPPDQAVPATQPVQFGQNSLVFSGIFIGLLLSILAIATDLPHILALRFHNASSRAEPRS